MAEIILNFLSQNGKNKREQINMPLNKNISEEKKRIIEGKIELFQKYINNNIKNKENSIKNSNK